MGAIIKIQPVFTYKSPPISSGTSRIVFLLLLRRDIPPGVKIVKLRNFFSIPAAKERLRLRPEWVKVCCLDVPPLLSTVEMRTIRHCNGFI